MKNYNMDSYSSYFHEEKEFWETVKSHLNYKGFFNNFPTPSLLREAQDEYRRISIDPPLDTFGKPRPFPTPTNKDEIIDRKDIDAIDAHAFGAPRFLTYEPMYNLVEYLVGECNNDVEKLRAIVRWIASQDLKQWHDEVSVLRDSAACYLARIRVKKSNHNQLLLEMCSLANIYCVKIRGFVKGVDYGLGQELTDCDSTWTGVLVDGTWRLLDIYWASCYRVHSDDSDWELIDDGHIDISSFSSKYHSLSIPKISKTEYAYNDFYFLTDPEQFIYSHFPVDERWQLLARPVTLAEAQQTALLKRHFFSIGMDICSHQKYRIECDDGMSEVTFATSPDLKVNYNYELFIETENEQSIKDLKSLRLERFVFLENVTLENLLNVKMRFPLAGKYKLKILAKEQDERTFHYTCTYIIDCLNAMENCKPWPKNERGEWEPGLETEQLGLEPISHDAGEVEANNGKAEVKFGMSKPIEFKYKLVTEDDEELKNRVLHRVEQGEAVFNIRVPDEGEYAFHVYAKGKCEKGEFQNVCNYLLNCEDEPEDKHAFPDVGVEKLGPTEAFAEYGMQDISIMPALMFATATEKVTSQLKLSQKAVFIAELLLHNDDDTETDFSEHTKWGIIDEVATFDITIPCMGMFSFTIRAKSSIEADTFTPIFYSVIDALKPEKECLPGPQQSIDWPGEWNMVKPYTGILAPRETTVFEIDFAKAFELIATSGNESKFMKINTNGNWEVEVLTGNEDSVVTICVRLSDRDEYHTILTYKVINKDEITRERLLVRHKDAVTRTETLKESVKLPKAFDWSKIEDTDETELKELEKTNVNLNPKHDSSSSSTDEDTRKWCKDFHEKNKWIQDVVPFRIDGKGETKILCYIPNDDTNHETSEDTYRGMEVTYRELNTCSKESLLVEKKYGSHSNTPTIAEIKKRNQLVNTVTHDLMSSKLHSNITMIGISQTKSKAFGTTDPKHEDEVCVVIYTRAKSYVPLGERLFPEYVYASDGSKFKTDVREGYFRLCPNGAMDCSGPLNEWDQKLMLGQSIGPASNLESLQYSGSLGPFVTVKEGNTAPYDAFLTAAHLFLDEPDNEGSAIGVTVNQPADGDEPAWQANARNPERRCGTVKHICFDATGDVGIDMAVVKIDEDRMPTRAHFAHITITSLTKAGFSQKNFPTYEDGSFIIDANEMDVEKIKRGRAVKFGKRTGLTVGKLLPDITNIAIEPWSLPRKPTGDKYVMTGQLKVNSSSFDDLFFQAGDSGAAVFFANKDDNKLHFIGMAIGITSDLYCLVTPAKALLTHKLNTCTSVEMKMKAF